MKGLVKEVDIRTNLPVATKGGTSTKPVWEINKSQYRFVKPLNKQGRDPKQHKARLSRTALMAKYVAGITKTGKPLEFVGVFQPI